MASQVGGKASRSVRSATSSSLSRLSTPSLLNWLELSGLGFIVISFGGVAFSTRRLEKRLREGLKGVPSTAHAKWKETEGRPH